MKIRACERADSTKKSTENEQELNELIVVVDFCVVFVDETEQKRHRATKFNQKKQWQEKRINNVQKMKKEQRDLLRKIYYTTIQKLYDGIKCTIAKCLSSNEDSVENNIF